MIMELTLIMSAITLLLIAFKTLHIKDAKLNNRISELESSLDESCQTCDKLRNDVSESKEICDKLNESNTKLTDELANARQEIWDYEIGTLEPGFQIKVKDMKSYILHLLHKQNAVLGINDEDKAWIRRLGGTIKEDINE